LVGFVDVLNGLKKVLSTNFVGHAIYSEPIAEGMTRPAFFIQLLPVLSSNFNDYYREQRALIDISYFSDEPPDLQSNVKNFTMANLLENALNNGIKVLDRNLNVQDLEFETVDRVLHSTINLLWYNENVATQAYLDSHENMQDVTISQTEESNI